MMLKFSFGTARPMRSTVADGSAFGAGRELIVSFEPCVDDISIKAQLKMNSSPVTITVETSI